MAFMQVNDDDPLPPEANAQRKSLGSSFATNSLGNSDLGIP